MFGLGITEMLIVAIMGLLPVALVVGLLVALGVHRRSDASNPNLRPCPDCGNMVSIRAETCPKCGCPLA